jgi:RNA polymerase sigma factor (sigma-70 family)
MNEKDRNTIWARFKDGDNDALSLLYSEFAHELYSYGLKVVNDKHLVKDCIQEVFVQLINRRKTLVVTSKLHVYLYKSLRNKIIEELRSKKRKQDILNLLDGDDILLEKNAEQKIIDSEKDRGITSRIESLLAKLPSRQKEIIYLKFTEGLDYDDIAELLQIDKASARTLLYRSIRTIKEQLSNNILLLWTLFSRNQAYENHKKHSKYKSLYLS